MAVSVDKLVRFALPLFRDVTAIKLTFPSPSPRWKPFGELDGIARRDSLTSELWQELPSFPYAPISSSYPPLNSIFLLSGVVEKISLLVRSPSLERNLVPNLRRKFFSDLCGSSPPLSPPYNGRP